MSVLFLAFLVVPLFAQQPYEAVVAGGPDGCFMEPLGGPRAEFIPDGPETSGIAAVAPAPGGRLFAATWEGPSAGPQRGFQIAELHPDGTLDPQSEKVVGWMATNVVVDREQTAYVLAHACTPATGSCSGAFANDAIIAINAQGQAGPIHVLGTGFASAYDFSGAMDLAADQCTLFLIQNGAQIRRFNVCTGAFLSDFASTAAIGESDALRVLPDGGLLVGFDDVTVRYTAPGAIAQTYSVQGRGGIGLIEGGATAWIAQRCLYDSIRLNLTTSAVTPSENIGLAKPVSMVPSGGWTAALGAHHTQNVPAASTVALIAMGALLSFAAFLRL